MSLSTITAPIQKDLVRVEKVFFDALKTDNIFVQQMVDYLAETRGKWVRPTLTLLSAKVAGLVKEETIRLAASIEMLHVATLIHDDIIDNSSVRRKQKTLNFKWGNEISVLMGDYVFASSFFLMTQNLPKEILELLSDTTNVICRGEISETFHRFNPNLKESEYISMIQEKTASLIAVSCQAGALLSGMDDDEAQHLYQFGMGLGTAFQVIDDTLDYVGTKEKFGKPVLSDFKEGKITLPVLHCLSVCSKVENAKIKKMVLKKVKTSADINWLSSLLKKYESVKYSQKRARQYAEEALDHLTEIRESPVKKEMRQFAEFLLNRDF